MLSYQRPFHHLHAHHSHRASHLRHALGLGCVGAPENETTTALAEAIKPLTGFGWEWRADGVILTFIIDGSAVRVFAPLEMIWSALHREMSAVGCPLPGGMGEPLSVGSIFGSIAHAVSHAVSSVAHAANSAAKAVVPKAIQKAAVFVVQEHINLAKTAINSKAVRYGLDAAAIAVPALAPAAAGLELAHQALEHVNQGIAAAKAIRNGVNTAANMAKAVLGVNTQHAVQQIVTKAQSGNPEAQRVVGAFQQIALARAAASSPHPGAFLAAALQHAPQIAVHQHALVGIAQAAQLAQRHALKPYRVHARAA